MEKPNINKKKSLAPQIISNNDKKINPYNILNNNNMKYFHNKYLIKIKEKKNIQIKHYLIFHHSLKQLIKIYLIEILKLIIIMTKMKAIINLIIILILTNLKNQDAAVKSKIK